MDIKEILEHVGIKARENIWIKPPAFPYAVFFDKKIVRGSDTKNNLIEHEIVIELYSDKPNITVEEKIEKELDDQKIQYETLPREYIDTEDMYLTRYEFNYLQKKGGEK